MTVQYNQFVLTGGPGIFFRLLLKWRGGVLKLISLDLIIFASIYILISCLYRFVITENAQRNFERLILFTSKFQAMIPVAFILGFYVALVFARFWNYFTTIPWVMSFALTLVTHLPGSAERNRLIRRTCMRYIMANLIITTAHLNVVVKKRFPTFELFVASGILTEDEARIIRSVQSVHMQPFVPVVWATSLITLARKEGLIKNPHAYVLLVNELNTFRQKILYVMMMDDVCIPLVYTQVAETLVNPMGEDDEDIDINEIIDFNWRISWCVVDGVRTSAPAIVRDAHWRQSVVELPHTERSRRLTVGSRKGSIYDMNVPVGPELRDLMAALSTARQMQMSSANSPAPSKSICHNESDSPRGESDDRRQSFPYTTTTNVVHEPIKEEDEELEDEQSGKDLEENKVNDEINDLSGSHTHDHCSRL
uniref:Bestrophin homolog n=2 Tax=Schistosoma mansoni TaxID=6183 RepID=A0A5K4EI21_SCHMA